MYGRYKRKVVAKKFYRKKTVVKRYKPMYKPRFSYNKRPRLPYRKKLTYRRKY
jgi:hypothetical protein